MPYVFYEEGEVPDGMECCDVVSREDYDRAVTDSDRLVTERDRLADQLAVSQEDLRISREKYANAVLSSAERAKREQADDVRRDSGPQTFAQLFSRREGV